MFLRVTEENGTKRLFNTDCIFWIETEGSGCGLYYIGVRGRGYFLTIQESLEEIEAQLEAEGKKKTPL